MERIRPIFVCGPSDHPLPEGLVQWLNGQEYSVLRVHGGWNFPTDGPRLKSNMEFPSEKDLLTYLYRQRGVLVVTGLARAVSCYPCIAIRYIATQDMAAFYALDTQERQNVLFQNQAIVFENREIRDRFTDVCPEANYFQGESSFQDVARKAAEEFYPTNTNEPIRFSIVTPSYNHEMYIAETIESVLAQNYSNFEYVVCDGGSTDGTVDVLRSYGSRLKWLSEKDSGYADAVNKGLIPAGGTFGLWLPSDDLFFDEFSLARMARALSKSPKIDVLFGESFYFDDSGSLLIPYKTFEFDFDSFKHHCYICQPSTTFRLEPFKYLNGLDITYRSIADYDLWIRMSKAGLTFNRLSLPISRYRLQDNSITVSQRFLTYREIFENQFRHFGLVSSGWVKGAVHELIQRQETYKRGQAPNLPRPSKARRLGYRIRRLIKQTLMSRYLGGIWVGNPLFQRAILNMLRQRVKK